MSDELHFTSTEWAKLRAKEEELRTWDQQNYDERVALQTDREALEDEKAKCRRAEISNQEYEKRLRAWEDDLRNAQREWKAPTQQACDKTASKPCDTTGTINQMQDARGGIAKSASTQIAAALSRAFRADMAVAQQETEAVVRELVDQSHQTMRDLYRDYTQLHKAAMAQSRSHKGNGHEKSYAKEKDKRRPTTLDKELGGEGPTE